MNGWFYGKCWGKCITHGYTWIPWVIFFSSKKKNNWLVQKNPHPVAHLLVVWWEKWPSIVQLPITKHSPDQKSTLLKTTVRWSTIAMDNKQNCRCISYWKKVDFPLLLWDYNKWNNSQYSYQIPWPPKPWKMKVSNQNIWVIYNP